MASLFKENSFAKKSIFNYFFEEATYSWKHKKYFFDNEVALGITRVEIGFVLAFLLLSYLNYLVFVKNF